MSRLAQLVERVTSNDEVSRSSRLMGSRVGKRTFSWYHYRALNINLNYYAVEGKQNQFSKTSRKNNASHNCINNLQIVCSP